MNPTTANFLSDWMTYVLPSLVVSLTGLATTTAGLVMLVRFVLFSVRAS